MSYYKILGFEKEPFSTSPDPEFLYMSKEHESALTNALIELNLRRGLNVILGEIGTGKTTLSRKLVQELSKRDKFLFQIIMNPSFENEKQIMASIMRNFNMPIVNYDSEKSLFDMRDRLEKFLLNKTLSENKTVILIIDEAQKLNEESLETLRILLNYETNEFKLVQILLLGQIELYSKIAAIQNFYDRINFKFTLFPLDLDETRNMVNFRLEKAGYKGKSHLFLDSAIREIFQYTNGYPRRVTLLCHKALKNLILRNKYVVDGNMIKDILQEEERLGWQRTIKSAQRNNSFCS